MRDDFTKKTIDTLAKRVGYCCSNPQCPLLSTSGPHDDPTRSVNIGVAAHITAASKGGPRYDAKISSDDRSGIKNGIWLCQNCANLIDKNEIKYTVEVLHQWKRDAEEKANDRMLVGPKQRGGWRRITRLLFGSRFFFLGCMALFIVMPISWYLLSLTGMLYWWFQYPVLGVYDAVQVLQIVSSENFGLSLSFCIGSLGSYSLLQAFYTNEFQTASTAWPSKSGLKLPWPIAFLFDHPVGRFFYSLFPTLSWTVVLVLCTLPPPKTEPTKSTNSFQPRGYSKSLEGEFEKTDSKNIYPPAMSDLEKIKERNDKDLVPLWDECRENSNATMRDTAVEIGGQLLSELKGIEASLKASQELEQWYCQVLKCCIASRVATIAGGHPEEDIRDAQLAISAGHQALNRYDLFISLLQTERKGDLKVTLLESLARARATVYNLSSTDWRLFHECIRDLHSAKWQDNNINDSIPEHLTEYFHRSFAIHNRRGSLVFAIILCIFHAFSGVYFILSNNQMLGKHKEPSNVCE